MEGTKWGKIPGLGGWSAGNIMAKTPQSLEALQQKIQERCIGIKLGLDDTHRREKKHLLLLG